MNVTKPLLLTVSPTDSCFLNMPFGLKMSQDVFQFRMDQVTDRLPSMRAIHGDICIYGQTLDEQNENVRQLMKTVNQSGLVFNSKKCSIH